MTFSDLGLPNTIIKAMNKMGWTEPTPVQEASIPWGLTGGDMFAQAQTGTGKTGAYASIILTKTEPGYKAPSALVLTPTRELAIQVNEEMNKLSEYTGHLSTVIYGGVGISPQISKLKKGTDIVIGTPGRLRDLIDQGHLDLSWVSTVVLDEADRMLDMGFARDLEYILSKIPKKRQMLMFSATMTPDIDKLAKAHMVKPKEFLVSADEPVLDLISQYYIIVSKDDKRDILKAIIDDGNPRTIVFCHMKHRAGQITRKMVNEGYIAATLHGDVPQAKREKTMKAFKDGTIDLLIATDVAARGLDIDDVEYVINYDMPDTPETYVHRIGRVGRAGKTGTAISFVMEEEKSMIKEIEKFTGKKISPFDMKNMPAPSEKPAVKAPVAAKEPVKRTASKEVRKPAAQAKEPVKRTPAAKEPAKAPAVRGKPAAKETAAKAPAKIAVSFQIETGTVSGLTKEELLEFLTTSGINRRDIGPVVVGKKASFIEVKCTDEKAIVSALGGKDLKGTMVKIKSV